MQKVFDYANLKVALLIKSCTTIARLIIYSWCMFMWVKWSISYKRNNNFTYNHTYGSTSQSNRVVQDEYLKINNDFLPTIATHIKRLVYETTADCNILCSTHVEDISIDLGVAFLTITQTWMDVAAPVNINSFQCFFHYRVGVVAVYKRNYLRPYVRDNRFDSVAPSETGCTFQYGGYRGYTDKLAPRIQIY